LAGFSLDLPCSSFGEKRSPPGRGSWPLGSKGKEGNLDLAKGKKLNQKRLPKAVGQNSFERESPREFQKGGRGMKETFDFSL